MPRKFLKNIAGQNIVEYTLVITLVLGAVMVMGPYVIRSWNGVVKGFDDSIQDSANEPLTSSPPGGFVLPCTCSYAPPCATPPCCGMGGCEMTQASVVEFCSPLGCGSGAPSCLDHDLCCTAPVPGIAPDDCGTNGCPIDQMSATVTCGDGSITNNVCIDSPDCTHQCMSGGAPVNFVTFESDPKFHARCPLDDINLPADMNYTTIPYGGCSEPEGSNPKCELQCGRGMVPSLNNTQCECPCVDGGGGPPPTGGPCRGERGDSGEDECYCTADGNSSCGGSANCCDPGPPSGPTPVTCTSTSVSCPSVSSGDGIWCCVSSGEVGNSCDRSKTGGPCTIGTPSPNPWACARNPPCPPAVCDPIPCVCVLPDSPTALTPSLCDAPPIVPDSCSPSLPRLGCTYINPRNGSTARLASGEGVYEAWNCTEYECCGSTLTETRPSFCSPSSRIYTVNCPPSGGSGTWDCQYTGIEPFNVQECFDNNTFVKIYEAVIPNAFPCSSPGTSVPCICDGELSGADVTRSCTCTCQANSGGGGGGDCNCSGDTQETMEVYGLYIDDQGDNEFCIFNFRSPSCTDDFVLPNPSGPHISESSPDLCVSHMINHITSECALQAPDCTIDFASFAFDNFRTAYPGGNSFTLSINTTDSFPMTCAGTGTPPAFPAGAPQSNLYSGNGCAACPSGTTQRCDTLNPSNCDTWCSPMSNWRDIFTWNTRISSAWQCPGGSALTDASTGCLNEPRTINNERPFCSGGYLTPPGNFSWAMRAVEGGLCECTSQLTQGSCSSGFVDGSGCQPGFVLDCCSGFCGGSFGPVDCSGAVYSSQSCYGQTPPTADCGPCSCGNTGTNCEHASNGCATYSTNGTGGCPYADGQVVCNQDCYICVQCFIKNTMITMADGSLKAIEDMQVGDQVLAADDAVNTVSELRITDHTGKIYSFNGGKHFVTGAHPFKTTDGWKAFEVDAAKAMNPDLAITLLGVGDVLINSDGTEIIETVSSEETAQAVYNLHLDGTQEYYANGYLVHNK